MNKFFCAVFRPNNKKKKIWQIAQVLTGLPKIILSPLNRFLHHDWLSSVFGVGFGVFHVTIPLANSRSGDVFFFIFLLPLISGDHVKWKSEYFQNWPFFTNREVPTNIIGKSLEKGCGYCDVLAKNCSIQLRLFVFQRCLRLLRWYSIPTD